MFRKDLIDRLRVAPVSIDELARELRLRRQDLAEDLRHAARTLEAHGEALRVDPATCKRCGFAFGPEKVDKPSRCPRCRSTWIQAPRLFIET